MKRTCLFATALLSLFSLSSCVTHESYLESARVIKKDFFEHSEELHSNIDHEKSSLRKRINSPAQIWTNQTDEKASYGLSSRLRYGLTKNLELSDFLSLDHIGFITKCQYLDFPDYAQALSLSFNFPLTSFDVPKLYHFTLASYHSYDLTEHFSFFLNPFFNLKPFSKRSLYHPGFSFGFLFGKERQLIAGYTYKESFSGSEKMSQESFSLGFKVKNRSSREKKEKSNKLKAYFHLGSHIFPSLSSGLSFSLNFLPSHSIGFSWDFGFSPQLPYSKRKGQLSSFSMLTSIFYENFFIQENFFFQIGLSKRDLNFSLESELGVNQHHISSYGASFALGVKVHQVYLKTFGVFIPISQLSHLKSLTAPKEAGKFDELFQKESKKWLSKISFSLFEIYFPL